MCEPTARVAVWAGLHRFARLGDYTLTAAIFFYSRIYFNFSFQMKTVSVALVICLNVGVDPPGIVRTQPCARLECWIGEIQES